MRQIKSKLALYRRLVDVAPTLFLTVWWAATVFLPQGLGTNDWWEPLPIVVPFSLVRRVVLVVLGWQRYRRPVELTMFREPD